MSAVWKFLDWFTWNCRPVQKITDLISDDSLWKAVEKEEKEEEKTWTLLADSEKRIQAFESKCTRKLLHISCLEHKTSYWVRSKINFLVGPKEPLLATVKRWKLAWFGHVTRHDSLFKTTLQGTLKGGRRRGRKRKCWMDNIKE